MRLAAFASSVLAALLAAPFAIGAHAAAGSATLPLKPCHVEGTKLEVRCGRIQVPENRNGSNRAKPGGRMLTLEVVVAPARKGPSKEPIFLLSGGPGQDATREAGFAGSYANDEHDIVLVALRGTGKSTLLQCELGGNDAHPEEYMEPLFHDGARYAECAKALSPRADLAQYTTMASMQDLDEVRKALGYDKVDLYGGSYGTRAGIVYMHMFPRNVHLAVLSGISAITERGPLYHAQSAQRSLDILFAQCAADAGCHKAFPDPKGDYAAIVDTLNKHPARVTIKNPANGKPLTLTLTATAFSAGLRVMLYDEATGRRLPLLLKGARAGEYTPFAQLAYENGRGLKDSIALGLDLSVTCAEDVSRIRPEEVAPLTAGSFMGDWRVRGQMAACSVWPKAPLPAEYTAPFTNDTPVLFISGNLDPVTPPHWAEDAQKNFPNSLRVVMPGAHVSDNDCVDTLIKQFLKTADPKGLDTACVAKTRLPAFALK